MKPFFNHSLSIKNSYDYQNFLRRRPKHALNFKFIMFQIPAELFHTDYRAVQFKLLKALKILKPVTTVDLSQFEVADSRSWKTTLPSVWKKISHVKNLFLMRPQNNSDEKYFKHFVRLQRLVYQLDGCSFPLVEDNSFDNPYSQNPLECLKYCPKVRFLEVYDHSKEGEFLANPIESKYSLRSLESFVFNGRQWEIKQVDFPMKFPENIKSISLFFDNNLQSQDPIAQTTMKILSTLANLQEIGLSMKTDVNSAFLKACKEIAQKGILKKLNLYFDSDVSSSIEKVLEAFKNCKLTSFSLNTYIKALNSISKFIKNMNQLESLELSLIKKALFSESDNFESLCNQMNKLQALRSLKLYFFIEKNASKSKTISNFIPNLRDLSTKPIKIETFRLECNQLDPFEALQSTISVLKNSAIFLRNLKIDFGSLTCKKQVFHFLFTFLQSLSNIQVLEIPSLEFNDHCGRFLNDIAEAIQSLKYLRIFSIGKIKETIGRTVFCRAIETISSKKGLRTLSCETSYDIKGTEVVDVKRIIAKNPSFEFIYFFDTVSYVFFFLKIYKWE